MTSLDHVEALIWASAGSLVSGSREVAGKAMDMIRAAIDDYALATYGITAERRAALAHQAPGAVHLRRPTGSAACGGWVPSEGVGTTSPGKVTCRRCKRTGTYRQALAAVAT